MKKRISNLTTPSKVSEIIERLRDEFEDGNLAFLGSVAILGDGSCYIQHGGSVELNRINQDRAVRDAVLSIALSTFDARAD